MEETKLRTKAVDPEVRKALMAKLQQQDNERKVKLELLMKFRQGQLTWEQVKEMTHGNQ